jgi:hypothetical protein
VCRRLPENPQIAPDKTDKLFNLQMFLKKRLDNILKNIYIPEVLQDLKAVKIRDFAM